MRVCNARNNGATLSSLRFTQVLNIGASVTRSHYANRVVGLCIRGSNISIVSNNDDDDRVVKAVVDEILSINESAMHFTREFRQRPERVDTWMSELPEEHKRQTGEFYPVETIDVQFDPGHAILGDGVRINVTMRDLAAQKEGFPKNAKPRYVIETIVETYNNEIVFPVLVDNNWQNSSLFAIWPLYQTIF